MNMEFTVNEVTSKYTLGKFLSHEAKLSRRLIISLKKTGGLFVNDKNVFTSYILNKGDKIKIVMPNEDLSAVTPQEMKLDIIYEDENMLVINKESGVAVHPTLNYQDFTLANGVAYYCKDNPFKFRPVNRLDKDTSGLVLIAKDKFTAGHLSKQLKENKITKVYEALVCGTPTPEEGEISAPIGLLEDSIIKRCVTESGAPSVTRYKVLKKSEKSLVEVVPITGRTHQIRVHMAYIGCPLYADFLYGQEVENEHFYLHCRELQFTHPVSNEKLTISCKRPF